MKRHPKRIMFQEVTGLLKRELWFYLFYYRPPTKLREGNVFTGTCHSVHCTGPQPYLQTWDPTLQSSTTFPGPCY